MGHHLACAGFIFSAGDSALGPGWAWTVRSLQSASASVSTAQRCVCNGGISWYTIWLFNIAIENSPFIDDFTIKTSIYKGFSMAILNNQMVSQMAMGKNDHPLEGHPHHWRNAECSFTQGDEYGLNTKRSILYPISMVVPWLASVQVISC